MVLFCLLGAGLLFKFKHHLPCLKQESPAVNTYRGFDRATIFHPHLGPRTLSDFSSSEESVATVAAAPARQAAHRSTSPIVTPLALRNYSKFEGYQATVRRNPSAQLGRKRSLTAHREHDNDKEQDISVQNGH